MKRLLCLLLFPLSIFAQTINLPGCTQAQVNTAFGSITGNGFILNIPSGSCTWTTQLSVSTQYSGTIQGQSVVTSSDTHGNPTAFTDSTLITDGQANSGGNGPIFSLSLTGGSGQVVRMTGISWHGGAVDSEYNGDLILGGPAGTQMRVDHNHFINEADLAFAFDQPMSGVIDHNEFDVTAGNAWNGVRIYNTGGGGYGDEPWAAATSTIWGTGSPVYLENNTFNNGYMNDCELGGTYVARYNTLNVTAANQNIGVQSHATGSQPRGRGCRAWEVYHNWLGVGSGTAQYTVGYQTSGTGVWWGNTTTNAGSLLDLTSDREGNNYSQTTPPAGWGYCGNNKTGSTSNWDGNLTSSGYPCLDNPGRGQGDMLSGYWNTVQNNTSPGTYTGVWPHEYLEPVYQWMETFSGSSSNLIVTSTIENNLTANQDYYVQVSASAQTSATSPFNGTTGTGYGILARRPTSCTPGPGTSKMTSPTGSYGVAYWATDANSGNGELYACTSTNTWTAIYQPYAYPHPLVSGTSLTGTTTSLSAASTSLSAGSSDLLNASVTSSAATGTVTIYDGGSSIGTCTLSSGACAYNVPSVSAGTHSYTAVYGGDSTYASSTSSAVTVTATGGVTIPTSLVPQGVALQ